LVFKIYPINYCIKLLQMYKRLTSPINIIEVEKKKYLNAS
jgi:hypothetical protein